jgi:hypothetical protein
MKAFVIASSVLLASGIAMAKGSDKKASHAGHSAPAMETLDADKDGKLSKDEVKADTALSGHFDTLDTNKDGFLDKDEVKAGKPAKAGK